MKRLSVITDEEKQILNGQNQIDTRIYTEQEEELVVDCEKLMDKGKLIQVRTHTRFAYFPKHRHNFVEVIYMCQGTTTHFINEYPLVLETGDLLFLNQHAQQEIMPAGEHDIAVNLIVQPEFFDIAFAMIGEEENPLRDFLADSLRKGGRASSYLYFHVADVLPIQNLVENMVWTVLYDQPNKCSSNQFTMGLLILQLLSCLEKAETDGKGFQQGFAAAVRDYIEEHYKKGTLTELAKLMGYEVYWLSREIKKRLGKSFKELQLVKRMNQACYLLTYSGLSIADILEMVGYNNCSYFYSKFKQRYGMTPKEYRKRGVK